MKKRLCGLLVCFVLLLGLVSVTMESVNAAPKMAVSDECIEMIKGFEGFDHGFKHLLIVLSAPNL